MPSKREATVTLPLKQPRLLDDGSWVEPTLDVERLRMERGWPTPNHMREAADACDARLQEQDR